MSDKVPIASLMIEDDKPTSTICIHPRFWSSITRIAVASATIIVIGLIVLVAILLKRQLAALEILSIIVDMNAVGMGGRGPNGTWALQHGFNRAPICQSGVSLQAELPLLGTTFIRTHDAQVLDIFTIFPNPLADPDVEASYNFVPGDIYFASILAVGHRAYFRLGVSWPPGPPQIPTWSLCPSAALMARISLRTVQHYNDAAWWIFQ